MLKLLNIAFFELIYLLKFIIKLKKLVSLKAKQILFFTLFKKCL